MTGPRNTWKKCLVEVCDRKSWCKGLCRAHYKRWEKGNPLDSPINVRAPAILEKYHPFYLAWCNMKTRCTNPTHEAYPYYGGRGITYSANWEKFINFYNDMFSTWVRGLSLDRINVNEGYYKENCRWIPLSDQAGNRRKRRP